MIKILLVDDESINLNILKHFFTKYLKENEIKYSITKVNNSIEAIGLHILYKYDYICLDVRMPEVDGIKVLETIRSLNIKQPHITMATACGDRDYKFLFNKKGANSYIIKPFKSKQVNQLLDVTISKTFKNIIIEEPIKKDLVEEVLHEEVVLDEFMDFDEIEEFEDFDAIDNEELQDEIKSANETHGYLSAEKFLSEFDTLEYILEDLDEIEDLTIELIDFLDEINFHIYQPKIEFTLSKYASFLNSFADFGHISLAITYLVDHIHNLDVELLSDKQRYYCIEMIKGIFEDLTDWKEHVFVLQDAIDVYYMNASLLSNTQQLENLIK